MKPASSAETATRTSAAGPAPRCSTKATRGWTWLHEAAARSTSCWTSAHRMKLVGCASANCGSSRVHSSSRLAFSVSPRPEARVGRAERVVRQRPARRAEQAVRRRARRPRRGGGRGEEDADRGGAPPHADRRLAGPVAAFPSCACRPRGPRDSGLPALRLYPPTRITNLSGHTSRHHPPSHRHTLGRSRGTHRARLGAPSRRAPPQHHTTPAPRFFRGPPSARLHRSSSLDRLVAPAPSAHRPLVSPPRRRPDAPAAMKTICRTAT